ncbi:alpha-L-rhamnosidase [Larkinella harenae]
MRYALSWGVSLGACAFVFLSTGSRPEPQPAVNKPAAQSWNELKTQFANPASAYGSGPLFVWNDRMRKSQLDTLLNDLHQAGFGGVFVHPRPGMITEYLSKDWFDLYRHTLQRSKEKGMELWIYDENSYPSGFAGGHVPDQYPESSNEGQGLRWIRARQVPDSAAVFPVILKKEGETWTNVTANWQTERGKTGTYALFAKAFYNKSPWYGGFSYVDLLKPGVTEKFIDVTMTRGYEKHFKAEFGKSIKGVFTDEPNIEAPGNGTIRWTPDLFEQFRKRWGYDLQPHLPALWEEVGPWKQVRHNYYQTLLNLFIDRWAKPWYTYCEQHNLEWTGHYWEHEWPNPNNGGDNMAMYAWHQRPAIDMLFNQFNEESHHAQFGNIRSVKELASVANQLGKSRTLSETYGGGGWEVTFQDFKRLGDWEYVLGVNYMNQHLSYATIKGARKYDYPPSFSYHEPWWPHYRQLNDYFRRLSLALSAGKQDNRVLVLEPSTTAWMYYRRQGRNPDMDRVGQEFQRFVTALEKEQIEYDLGSENIIENHGAVEKAAFRVGQRAYDVVILPPLLENLDRKTADLLKTYAANGGKVLDFSKWELIDGKAVGAESRVGNTASWQRFPAWEPKNFRQLLPNPEWQIRSEPRGGKFYHQRRVLTDGQLLFSVNADLADSTHCRVALKGQSVYEMDAFTGAIRLIPHQKESEFVVLNLALPPAGSKLLFVSNQPAKGAVLTARPLPAKEMPAAGPTRVKAVEPNVLTLDFCDVTVGDSTRRDIQIYAATDWVFKEHGFKAGNPWNTSVQYKTRTIARDTFTAGTGYRTVYRFIVAEGVKPAGWEAVVESNGIRKVIKINGQVVQAKPGQWWLDRSFWVYPIGAQVRPGVNEIEVIVNPMRVYAEIEPVYIRGDFALESAAKGWQIVPGKPLQIGSWKKQGWPFFGRGAEYTQTYTLSTVTKSYTVQLDEWAGTVAEVVVNGKTAGIIAYPPYTLPLGGLLRSGKNDVTVRVIGSNKNLLGPHHRNPKPGLVSPWLFRGVAVYPPGHDYQQLDYGLMKPFRLLTN